MLLDSCEKDRKHAVNVVSVLWVTFVDSIDYWRSFSLTFVLEGFKPILWCLLIAVPAATWCCCVFSIGLWWMKTFSYFIVWRNSVHVYTTAWKMSGHMWVIWTWTAMSCLLSEGLYNLRRIVGKCLLDSKISILACCYDLKGGPNLWYFMTFSI